MWLARSRYRARLRFFRRHVRSFCIFFIVPTLFPRLFLGINAQVLLSCVDHPKRVMEEIVVVGAGGRHCKDPGLLPGEQGP